ncbi:hypothetical protein UA08_04223 [Talaromyces atroroseus]|uniref:Rab-GAP TBC domain-containing protein n=1 Tax=Talaromyces atroroseus TaxID=1441469 RepID=A0A1Q5Q9F7_TALAT|nr:hypothetical protein UA08_04223 [Talaromyces atroroseus]OKL60659.1 hypothetical protein UA08_04223 [Talaromyces atroroseus]
MKSVEEASCGSNTNDIRQAVKSEDGENPCENGLRSVCWKVFLLCEDLDRPEWTSRLSDTRSAYESLRNHFLKYIKHPNEIQSTIDPLAEDEESPWQALRHDETTRAEIYQDVERCLQDNFFFREPSTKSMMLDILFIYSKLNPDLGYRQGMHELLAPIIWVVERDAVAFQQSRKVIQAGEIDDEDIMLQLLDANYIESDSFNLFCSVMQVARAFYEHTDSTMVNGQAEVAPIVDRSQFIHHELLQAADHELATHLRAIEILPQIFLTRWIRLLFGREFSFEDTLLIWDLLFANGLTASLVDHICVAMLLRIRWQLLSADYSSALTLLLRYPTPQDHSPHTFVQDGLYLEQNSSPARGAFLISKYSGRLPVSAKKPSQHPSRDLSPKVRQRSHSRNASEDSSSGQSPVRNSQRTLESLFQDVSEGLQRRTEGWGVAKAVRGAVTEARRNMAYAEVGGISPSRAWRGGSRLGTQKIGEPERSDPVDLVRRVASLKKRDSNLAEMLSEALNDLQYVKQSVASIDSQATEALGRAFEKILSVQTDLQGSGGSTPTKPIQESTKEAVSEKIEPDKIDEKPEVLPMSATASLVDGNQRSETQAIGSATTTAAASPKPQAESAPVPAPRPTTTSLPRRPLAQSEFSWMLGDTTHRSSFVSSASLPPDQSRQSEPQSRQGSLFGEAQDETREQEDSLSLSSFT